MTNETTHDTQLGKIFSKMADNPEAADWGFVEERESNNFKNFSTLTYKEKLADAYQCGMHAAENGESIDSHGYSDNQLIERFQDGFNTRMEMLEEHDYMTDYYLDKASEFLE